MGERAAPRPIGVTVVVVLTWAIAAFSVISGLVLLTADARDLLSAGVSKDTANAYGLFEIAFGFVVALVAVGLANGNNLSRFLVTALMIARLIASVWAAFALFGEPHFWAAAGIGALALVVLFLLYRSQANRFFATR